jgi:hypothetical protein
MSGRCGPIGWRGEPEDRSIAKVSAWISGYASESVLQECANRSASVIVNDVTNCNARPVSEMIVIFRTIAL